MTNANKPKTLNRTTCRTAALLLFSACALCLLLCDVSRADEETGRLEYLHEIDLSVPEQKQFGGLLGQRYVEVSHQTRPAHVETLRVRFDSQSNGFGFLDDQVRGYGATLNLPLSEILDWQISFGRDSLEYRYEVSNVEVHGTLDIERRTEFIESVLIHHFRPRSRVNPYIGLGLGYQSIDLQTKYHFQSQWQPRPSNDTLILESDQGRGLFSIQSGVEFSFLSSLSVRTYLKTEDSLNHPDIVNFLSDYVNFHLESRWKIGEDMHVSSRVSTRFHKSDLGFTFMIGSSF